MTSEHLKRIEEQLEKGPKIGRRGTPVVSFWDMRSKWRKYGQYWELWGTDGDLIHDGEQGLIAPAELKLVYFVIPGTEIVCQLAYEHDPEQVEDGSSALRRAKRVEDNMKQALRKASKQVA